jgi:hypothetical protein
MAASPAVGACGGDAARPCPAAPHLSSAPLFPPSHLCSVPHLEEKQQQQWPTMVAGGGELVSSRALSPACALPGGRAGVEQLRVGTLYPRPRAGVSATSGGSGLNLPAEWRLGNIGEIHFRLGPQPSRAMAVGEHR